MFIINALKHDAMLRQGIQYIKFALQAYQRDLRLNPTVQFPLKLNFNEIGVVIDKQRWKNLKLHAVSSMLMQ